jgi:hypothetical protein
MGEGFRKLIEEREQRKEQRQERPSKEMPSKEMPLVNPLQPHESSLTKPSEGESDGLVTSNETMSLIEQIEARRRALGKVQNKDQ